MPQVRLVRPIRLIRADGSNVSLRAGLHDMPEEDAQHPHVLRNSDQAPVAEVHPGSRAFDMQLQAKQEQLALRKQEVEALEREIAGMRAQLAAHQARAAAPAPAESTANAPEGGVDPAAEAKSEAKDGESGQAEMAIQAPAKGRR